MLGEQYVGLEPGGSEQFMAQGAEVSITQSAVILEQLIGQFLYQQGGSDGGGGAKF